MTIIPAYGRSYKTAHEVIKDWNANKDFRMFNGPYLNLSDFNKYYEPLLDTVTYDYKGLHVTVNIGCII